VDAELAAFSVMWLVLVSDLRLRKLLRRRGRGQRCDDSGKGNQSGVPKKTSA
jgi:hypothetical protein